MALTITLRRPATCRQCGAHLPAGSRARWYKNGAVYGLHCHERSHTERPRHSAEDYACSDLGYEDACREACGL